MMKPTQFKDAFRNIRKQFISFFSIAIVLALGVTVFLGCRFTAISLGQRADSFYEETAYHDMELKSPAGFFEEDLAAVKALSFVEDAEGILSAEMYLLGGDAKQQVHVLTLTERLDQSILFEGALPKAQDECAVMPEFAEILGLSVGDTLHLAPLNEGQDFLKIKDLKITGIVRHPDQYRVLASGAYNVLVSKDAMEVGIPDVPYTGMLVRTDTGAVPTFSKDYSEKIQEQIEPVLTLGKERYGAYLDELNAKIADGEKELQEGKAELQKAKKEIQKGEEELQAGKQQLKDAKVQIQTGEAQLADGARQLKEAEAQLASAEAQLAEGKEKLAEGEKTLKKGREKLDKEEEKLEGHTELVNQYLSVAWVRLGRTGKAPKIKSLRTYTEQYKLTSDQLLEKMADTLQLSGEQRKSFLSAKQDGDEKFLEYLEMYNQLHDAEVEYSSGEETYQASKQEWDNGNAAYQQGLLTYQQKQAEYQAGAAALAAGKQAYQESLAEYQAGKQALKEGKAEYKSKKQEYKEGVQKLEEGKAQVASLSESGWVVLDRSLNLSWMDTKNMQATLQSVAGTFAVMFILLGILVCYATIGKIIDEQRRLVGATKAVGFQRGEILGKYMFFGVSASILGILLGFAGSFFVLEPAMLNMISGMYFLQPFPRIFQPAAVLFTLLGGIVISVLAVWIACSRLIKQPAKYLMSGEEPKTFFRKSKGGSRRSLYSGMLVRNMVSDWKRVLITVVSIAGSCMLLVVGATMKNSYAEITSRQFSDVIRYEALVSVLPEKAEQTIPEVLRAAEEANATAGTGRLSASYLQFPKQREGIQMISMQEEAFADFFHLTDPRTGADLKVPEQGLMISMNLAAEYGLKPGDTVSLLDGNGVLREAVIGGTYTCYAAQFVFLSKAYEAALFGEALPENAVFLRGIPEGQEESLKDGIKRISGVMDYMGIDKIRGTYVSVTKLMDFVILATTVMAAMMAAIVLLNLVRIQINQKKRELTVMRINGFSTRETVNYILRENVLTTSAGVLLGLVAGIFASRITLHGINNVNIHMYDGFMPLPLVFAAVVTFLFAAIVNFFALRKIRTLKLSDVND